MHEAKGRGCEGGGPGGEGLLRARADRARSGMHNKKVWAKDQ